GDMDCLNAGEVQERSDNQGANVGGYQAIKQYGCQRRVFLRENYPEAATTLEHVCGQNQQGNYNRGKRNEPHHGLKQNCWCQYEGQPAATGEAGDNNDVKQLTQEGYEENWAQTGPITHLAHAAHWRV